MPPRALVLRAPGANCDNETAYALQQAGAAADIVHLNRWLESPRLASDYQVLCIPGGFSYGDDVAAGRVLANQLRHHLGEPLSQFRDAGKLILGICNGFQVLIKSGLLDTDDANGAGATLTWNTSGRFVDRWTDVEVVGNLCPMLAGISRMHLPIAHAEGRFVGRDEAALDRLQESGQIVLRYAQNDNPNGAQRNVAGMCDRSGRVLGLMPHPERFIDRMQHPQWTRRPEIVEGDGLRLFRNITRYFA